MHKCVRCGKLAASLEAINAGCECGSKVFVFNKNGSEAVAAEAKKDDNGIAEVEKILSAKTPGVEAGSATPQVQAESAVVMRENGKAPSSYFARTMFTTDDIENIRVQSEGVFMLDISTLSKNPVVLKDEEGVYYVKLPFDQKKQEGNGKKKR